MSFYGIKYVRKGILQDVTCGVYFPNYNLSVAKRMTFTGRYREQCQITSK